MISNFSLKQNIILLLTLLACIDFMGMGIYIMSSIIVVCLFLYTNLFYRCICSRLFLKFFTLCFISIVLYCIQTSSLNRNYIASILVIPIGMYIAGYCLIESYSATRMNLISTILIFAVITAGYGFVTAMNKGDLSAYSAYSDEYINNLMRTSYNIWNHRPIAGTVLSPFFVLIIAVVPYSIVYLKRIKRILLVIFAVLGITGSLILGSRANIVVFLFSFLVVLMCALFKLNEKQKLLKELLLALGFIVIMISSNIGGIQDKILDSTLFYRLSVMDTTNSYSLFDADGRFDILGSYLGQLFNHPFGGISIDTGHSAHNTILQYGAFGGFICLFFALWFFIPLFASLIKFIWRDRSDTKIMFMPIVISILMLFMVESISISNSIIYSLFIMVLVMVRQFYIKE